MNGLEEIEFSLPPPRLVRWTRADLTRWEVGVLQKLANGASRKEFVTQTRSIDSVYNMIRIIRLKLGARSSEHAIAIGYREELIK